MDVAGVDECAIIATSPALRETEAGTMARTQPATVYAVPLSGQDEVQNGAFAGGIRVCVHVEYPQWGDGVVVDIFLAGNGTYSVLTERVLPFQYSLFNGVAFRCV